MLRKLKSKNREDTKSDINIVPRFVNEKLILPLANTIFDWQLVNGILLKYRDEDSIKAKPVSVSLVPTPFPKHLFERALGLQKAYNELYAKVSSDEEWLLDVLEGPAKQDGFIRTLIEIHKKVKGEGFAQNLTLGVFRSDYMLHRDKGSDRSSDVTLKQVEINSTSCAGGSHATHTAEMHAYMARAGAFQQYDQTLNPSSLPPNPGIRSIVSALASAHAAYGPPKSAKAKETVILMVVQPYNFNVADERPIEYGLCNLNPPVPTHRCIFRPDVLKDTTLTADRELLYHPPYREGLPPVEISAVYYRAGSHEHEYDLQGQTARLQLARSKAIQCPNILGQLSGSKVVQQALSEAGALSRFITNEDGQRSLTNSFGRMWPLDTTALGMQGRALALDPEAAVKYVLKPNRDGGGNNIYRAAIPAYLRGQPESSWSRYILMELFDPPDQDGKLMTGEGIYEGSVVSELGIIGTCLWRRDGEVLENGGAAGWTFKTKPVHVDEMSVVKGYGCFDCPRLV